MTPAAPPVVDAQLNPSVGPWSALRERALAVEAAGYGALWTFDHLAGSSLRGDTMFESFTLLGALAASTTTIELGVLVANVFNRTPAVLGVAAATLEAIADRPVHLGLGAGAAPDSRWSREMRAVGQPVAASVAERHERVTTTLDVLDRLFDPGRDAELATFPLPRRRPTVVLGVNGVVLAALAGRRADGVNVGWDHPRRDELLEVARRARGDRPGFVATTWLQWAPELLDPDHPTRRAMADRHLDRVVLTVPPSIEVEALATPLSQ
jgi:alkanesulfonate monooxygenase SsuD/methylene tetrahydromethanopterin reductase-like flavin-dependent oxidoreductase (luciferase family)